MMTVGHVMAINQIAETCFLMMSAHHENSFLFLVERWKSCSTALKPLAQAAQQRVPFHYKAVAPRVDMMHVTIFFYWLNNPSE